MRVELVQNEARLLWRQQDAPSSWKRNANSFNCAAHTIGRCASEKSKVTWAHVPIWSNERRATWSPQ
jgi:hypothetical protein